MSIHRFSQSCEMKNQQTETRTDNLLVGGRSILAKAVGVAIAAASLGMANTVSAEAIEEVVVTAQKRAQSAQDVSIAVTVFGGEEMDKLGVATPGDLAAFTPNLNFKNASGSSNAVFTLRGAGVSTFASNAINSVGVYVDEVYQPSNIMMGFALFDIERVEVLRGPQGTLFGRNTTGGAISFVTKKPSEEPDNHIKVSVGDYESFGLEGGVNFTLSDSLTGRFAFKHETQNEGYFTNRLDGDDVGDLDRFSGRFSLAWRGESTQVDFSFHAGRDDSEYWPWQGLGIMDVSQARTDSVYGGYPAGLGFQLSDFAASSRLCAPAAAGNVGGVIANASCVDAGGFHDADGNDPFSGEYSADLSSSADAMGAVLKVSHDFDKLTFTSVTGYDTLERDATDEFDGGPFPIGDINYINDVTAFQQEFRLDGSTDKVTWVTGLFYSLDENKTDTLYGYQQRVGTDLLVNFDQETEVMAIFANAEWSLLDNLRLVTGVRYTEEETSWEGATSAVNLTPLGADVFGIVSTPGVIDPWGGGLAQNDQTISEEKVTYKVGLDYDLTNEVLLYTHFSYGFKSGGFNGTWATSFDETRPFESETVESFEVGFKSTLLEGSLILNGSFYYTEYQDIQLFGFNSTTGIFGITNAADAEVSGLELEAWWKPTDQLDIKAGLGLTDSELVEVQVSPSVAQEGNRLPNTSEVTFNALISYAIPLGDSGMTLTPNYSASFTGEQFFQPDNSKLGSQDDYWVHNFSLQLEPDDGKWLLSAWVKNLDDELYFTESFVSTSAGVAARLPGAPRTYGLEFTYFFN